MKIEETDFLIYEQIVLSGQMPHDRLMEILDENADFAEWYRNRAERRRSSTSTVKADNDEW